MAHLWQSSVGRIPANTNNLPVGVDCSHPVTMCKASLIGLLMSQVWGLQHQTGEQYSAVLCSRARVAVHNVVVPAPQANSASFLKSPMHVVNFLYSASRYWQNVRSLSNFMLRYVGSAQYGRAHPSTMIKIFCHASLLLRWKTTNTLLAVLSFNFYFWSYKNIVAMS